MRIRFSVRGKFLTLIFVIVSIVNIGVGVISIRSAEKGYNMTTKITMDSVSSNVANQINDLIEQEFTLITGLSKLPDINDPNKTLEEKIAVLSDVKNIAPERYNNIGYCNAKGDSLVGNRVMNFSKNDLYQVLQTKDRYVSDPSPSSFTDGYLMYYSVPVKSNGKFDGAIMSVVTGNYLDVIAESMDLGDGYNPIILNYSTKEVIGEKLKAGQTERTSIKDLDMTSELGQIYTQALAAKTGYSIYVDPVTNTKMIASYRPVPNAAVTWAVFCAAPYDYYCSYMHKIHTNVVFCFIMALILTFLLGTLLIKMIIGPLLRVKNNMEDIATGNADLTQRITQTTYDEIGQLVEGFNSFTEKMQDIVKDIKDSNRYLGEVGEDLDASTEDTRNSINQIIENINDVHKQIDVQAASVHETAGAVNEIASNIDSLETMIENQTAGVAEASSAIEEMIGNINSVNVSVERMATSFENLISNAKEGSAIQSDVNQKISEIRSQSETLQEANLAIAAIAEQTNLLAMNAAIEAAHAGESGKGFSVVADEIRKLSETSTEQSKTIGTQLTSIQEAIIEVVDACNKSSVAFETMSDGISQTDEVVRQIKEAMDEQNEGSKQISLALQNMNDSTIEVRTSGREMAEGNKAILEEVKNLQDATGVMKDSMGIMSDSARKINETGIALTDISKKMRDSIQEISNQIGQFKV